jgi:transcription-repair coupling factor (superfamily II helicase)
MNEYKDLFAPKESVKQEGLVSYTDDCQIDTDLELLFPDDYISSITERMNLYRDLDQVQEEDELLKFESDLSDRFGPLPDPSRELLEVVRLRWLAGKLAFEKLILKNNKLIGYFISDQRSHFYKSKTFSQILGFVQKQPSRFRMKEGNNRLTLTCEHIPSVHSACDLLKLLYGNEN